MKKKYSKPIAVIESFQLDTGVAACSDNGYSIGRTEYDCEYGSGSAVFFVDANSDCVIDIVNPNEFNDKLCYHGYNNPAHIIFISS